MTTLDDILCGLEQALELERELGVRVVVCDRSLLADAPPSASPAAAVAPPPRPSPPRAEPVRSVRAPEAAPSAAAPAAASGRPEYDFVFLHDRPLSEKGAEMIAKITAAMHRTPETAPVVVGPPVPRAKIYVVLGGRAMKRFFPQMNAAPGQWAKTRGGRDVLISNSPEYILRFGEDRAAMDKIKKEMWRNLKGVTQRLNLS